MRPNECAKAFVSPITQLAILPEAQTTALQGRLLKKKTCPEPFSCTCSVALSKWVAGANKTIWISVYLPCMKFSEGGSPRTCSWQLWSSPQGESRVFAPLSFHSLHQDVFISGSCMLRSVQRMGQNPSLLKNLLNELRVEDLYLPGLQRGEKKEERKRRCHPVDLESCYLTSSKSPEPWETFSAPGHCRTLLGQARHAHCSSATHSEKKGSQFLTNKMWARRQPPSFWAEKGQRLLLGERLDPGGWVSHWWWKDLTLPGLFMQRVAGQRVCPGRYQNSPEWHILACMSWWSSLFISLCHQRPLCSNSRADSHPCNNLQYGAKSKTQQQLYYPQTFRQRHLPDFTWWCCSVHNSYATVRAILPNSAF